MSGRTAFGVNLGFKKLPGGTIATTGPLRVEGSLVADSASFAGPLWSQNLNQGLSVGRTKLVVIGTSTVANSYEDVSGIRISSCRSMWERANSAMGCPFDIRYYGFSGKKDADIIAAMPGILAAEGACSYVIQSGSNDLDNTLASADTAFADLLAIIDLVHSAAGSVIVHIPHAKVSTSANYRGVARYSQMVDDYCAANGIISICAPYAIANGLDRTMSAKTDALVDNLHVGSGGAQFIADEIVATFANSGRSLMRILPCGNAECASEALDNPRMVGSAGTVGTGVTGTVPDLLNIRRATGSGAAVAAVGTDAEGAYCDLTITAAAANELYYVSLTASTATLLSRISGTKNYRARVDYEILTGNASISRVSANVSTTTSGVLSFPRGASSSWTTLLPVGRRRLRSQIIPGSALAGGFASVEMLGISTSAAGEGTVRLRGLSLAEAIA